MEEKGGAKGGERRKRGLESRKLLGCSSSTHRSRRVVWACSEVWLVWDACVATLPSRTPALLRATDGDESTRRPASSFLVAGGAVRLSALHDAELTTYNATSIDPFLLIEDYARASRI
ncbi:uncharacterized protein LOC143210844 isoform X2 [Lasioglossum baleicum]|uniref:uncharacterized protein LOC143210844 isoform X2 n=1 Tax=Lasioglossum baleicum TaxID=434251 RepID=UPI003FCE97EA